MNHDIRFTKEAQARRQRVYANGQTVCILRTNHPWGSGAEVLTLRGPFRIMVESSVSHGFGWDDCPVDGPVTVKAGIDACAPMGVTIFENEAKALQFISAQLGMEVVDVQIVG